MKRLILCADDYAVAPGVSRAIRDLAASGRLNATSVMAPGPDLELEAAALKAIVPDGFRIGLHVTLTGGLTPLTLTAIGGVPARFTSLPWLMAHAHTGRLDQTAITDEVDAQFLRFAEAFGRPPAFVDGHQHVHTLPVLRSIVLGALRRHAPGAFVRQCSGPRGAGEGIKASLIAALSSGLSKEAARMGVPTNPAFSGAYDFKRSADFAAIFPRFLDGMPDGSLVMIHPGYVDDALRAVDPLTDAREHERAYLASDAFLQALAQAGFRLG
ncbi:MAG: ChbG/HpnK family deacetylase [Alphaproteobacteria bacterium]